MLRGAIAARGQVGLKLNVPRANLDAVLKLIPSAHSPTVNDLADSDWVAIEVLLDRTAERELVPKLSRAGAQAIFSYPVNKIIP